MGKYKYAILGSFITLIILIIISIISINFKYNELITIKEVSDFDKKITILEKDISKVDSGICQDKLYKMLKKIRLTNLSGEVSVKEYYKTYFQDETFLEIFEEVKNECELDDDETDPVYIRALSATLYPNEIKKRFQLAHEISFKDSYNRKLINKSNDETGTFITKTLELQVLKDLISEAK